MYRWIRPLLFKMDAETAHRLAIGAAKVVQALPTMRATTTSANLQQDLWGIRFPNPVGIAAGLDKNAECIPYWIRIGCGFVEIGSVSAEPAPGNPRPRAFRLPDDEALVNRMGLNNDGAAEVAKRLPKPSGRPVPIGINIVKTHREGLTGEAALADFCESYRVAAAHADYVTVNVSCPNTSDGKTFEEPDALDTLLYALLATGVKRQPLLVKLSPPSRTDVDEGRFAELAVILQKHEVDGIVATNTAPDRLGLESGPARIEEIGPGGLSGKPLAERSTSLIRFLYRQTGGSMPIIGVGGVDSASEALRKIRAGASLVQLYTGLVYEGPRLIGRIVRGMARHLEREGRQISEIVGADA